MLAETNLASDYKKMTRRLKDIENHLERSDARFERFKQIESERELRQLIATVIKLTVGVIAVLCAISAVYNQYSKRKTA